MTRSIQDMTGKLKAFIEEDVYFYTLLIIVVSVLSFGLGRVSMSGAMETAGPQVVLMEQPAAVLESSLRTAGNEAVVQQLVASKKGTKYHLVTCPGAKQMSDTNKVYFNSEVDAEAAGYTRAKNCEFN